MGYCIINEPILPIDIVGCFICFAAFTVLIMTDNEKPEDVGSTESAIGIGGHLLGAILTLVASWLNASAIVANRLLKGIDIFTVCFFHGLIGLTLGTCYMIYEGNQNGNMLYFLEYTPMQYFLVALSCIFDTICLYTLFIAAQSGSQSFIGLIMYTSIVYAFLFDIFYFHEQLSIREMGLASVILITTLGVSLYKIRSEKKIK